MDGWKQGVGMMASSWGDWRMYLMSQIELGIQLYTQSGTSSVGTGLERRYSLWAQTMTQSVESKQCLCDKAWLHYCLDTTLDINLHPTAVFASFHPAGTVVWSELSVDSAKNKILPLYIVAVSSWSRLLFLCFLPAIHSFCVTSVL